MDQEIFGGGDAETLKGEYADCFRIGHSAHKFVLDFGQLAPDGMGKIFHTRVVTGPDTAKAIFENLNRIILEYEEQFGGIPERDK